MAIHNPTCPFDAIVVTSPNERAAEACTHELKLVFSRACSVGTACPVMLAIHDPDGNRIGSGGGTVNALDAAARALATRKFPEVNLLDLDLNMILECAAESRILIVHSGGDSQRSPLQSVCGKAWCALSSVSPPRKCTTEITKEQDIIDLKAKRSLCFGPEHPVRLLSPPRTPIELLIGTLCRMSENLPLGSCVIACADVLLLVPPDLRLGFFQHDNIRPISNNNIKGSVCGLAIPADEKFGPHHGCFTLDRTVAKTTANQSGVHPVVRYLQKASHDELIQKNAINQGTSTVLVDTGVIAFDQVASSNILKLAHEELSGSTLSAQRRAQLDPSFRQQSAVRTELYSDFLLAVSDVGGFNEPPSNNADDGKLNFLAFLAHGKEATSDESIVRSKIWDSLHACSFSVAIPPASPPTSSSSFSSFPVSRFGHLGTTLEQMAMLRGELQDFVIPFGITNRVLVNIDDVVQEQATTSAKEGNLFSSCDNVMINCSMSCSSSVNEKTFLGHKAVAEHCRLVGNWAIGDNSFVSGIRNLGISSFCNIPIVSKEQINEALLKAKGDVVPNASAITLLEEIGSFNGYALIVPPDMCLQEIKVSSLYTNNFHGDSNTATEEQQSSINSHDCELFVTTLLGISDKVKANYQSSEATFCGMSWMQIFEQTKLSPQDIWDDFDPKTLWHAKLFPVYEINHKLSSEKEKDDVGTKEPNNELIINDWQSDPSLLFWPLWLSLHVSFPMQFSSMLIKWKALKRLSLKMILNQSNPKAEFEWRHHLEEDIGRSIVTRAIPHFVLPAVSTASVYAQRSAKQNDKTLSPCFQTDSSTKELSSSVKEFTVECPARIDMSGGWTDTPPICYEQGGSVVNLAVAVDGQLPIKASAFISPVTPSSSSSSSSSSSAPLILSISENEKDIFIDYLEQLSDFSIPTAPGALLKAALIVAGVVNLDSTASLQNQIHDAVGGTLKLQSRSYLPVGSGMGTSSILAGAILAVLGLASNHPYSDDQLVHAVLSVEQLLTTGGGWQDQVGGCYPGSAKWCTSDPCLPLKVSVQPISIPSEDFRSSSLRTNLVLVFTGRSRLAKNVLVEVVRRWWGENDGGLVREAAKQLLSEARGCAKALESGDISTIGTCLSRYHSLKRTMAGVGYEPLEVKRLMQELEPFVHGMSLCGAGGGGFLVLITKTPFTPPQEDHSSTMKGCWGAIHEVVRKHGGTAHSAHLVENGMGVYST